MIKHKSLTISVALVVVLSVDSQAQQKSVAPDANAEAKRAFELGRTAIDKGDGPAAVQHLSKAVKQFPKNAEYRHALSRAYETAGKPGDAWFQIRQAVQLSANSRKSQIRFQTIWRTLAQKGVFNVGQTKANVQKQAGKPDRLIKGNGGEQWGYAYMNVNFVKDRVHSFMDIRGMALAKLRPQDVVEFDVDQAAWTLTQRRISFYDARQVYLPKGQTGSNWSEMLIAVRFFSATKKSFTVDKMLEQFKKETAASDPNAKYTVLERKVGDIMYEMTSKIDGRDVHTVGAIIAGRADGHHVAHIVRGKRSTESRDGWLQFLRDVNLKSTTKE